MKKSMKFILAVAIFHLTVTQQLMADQSQVLIRRIAQGNEGGNGGLGVVRDGKAYLLDFVENKISKTAYLFPLPQLHQKYCKRFGMFNACMEYGTLKPGDFGAGLQSVVRSIHIQVEGSYKEVWFLDSIDSYFDRMISKSNERNEFLFGEKLSCEQSNCYDQKAMLSATLANQFAMEPFNQNYTAQEDLSGIEKLRGSNTRNFDYVRKRFIDYFSSLDWVATDEELTNHHDENSAEPGERIVIAERDSHRVKISKTWWKTGKGGVLPLDFVNKLGLIVHEAYYSWTESQGDVFSDRARTVSALIFLDDVQVFDLYGSRRLSILDNLLKFTPSRPKPSNEVKYVHEINSSSRIQVNANIPFGSGMCASFMFDPLLAEPLLFSSNGYLDSELGKDRFERVIFTETKYIHGNICLKSNFPEGFSFENAGVQLSPKSVFTIAPEFRSKNYTKIFLNDSSGKLDWIEIHNTFERGAQSIETVTVEDFNKMYGKLIEIIP